MWTPVRVIRLTPTLVEHMKRIASLNRHKDKKTGEKKAFPITHPKYGVDVQIMYDKDAPTAAQAYSVQKDEKTPLTDEEKEYALWNIEDLMKPEELARAQAECDRWKKANVAGADDEDDSDDEDEDDDEPKAKSKSKSKPAKGKSKSKSKSRDDDEDDDDDDLDD